MENRISIDRPEALAPLACLVMDATFGSWSHLTFYQKLESELLTNDLLRLAAVARRQWMRYIRRVKSMPVWEKYTFISTLTSIHIQPKVDKNQVEQLKSK